MSYFAGRHEAEAVAGLDVEQLIRKTRSRTVNTIKYSDDPKPYKLFGKGTVVITLPGDAKITTEVDAGVQRLIVRSAMIYTVRRGPRSSVTLKGDADFDTLKREFSPSASIELKLDKTATMSLSMDRDKATFKLKVTL